MLHRYAYLWYRHRRVQRFLARADQAARIQREVLLAKLRRNAASQFGRDHGFGSIRSVADYRRQVPITRYEYYRDYIEAVKTGRVEAMFGPGTRVLMFALTSGTTADCKFLPITQEFFDEYRASWNLWGLRTFRDHRDLVLKKTVQLSSDWRQFYTSASIPCGNISGLAAETAPRISRPVFLIPRELIRIGDPRVKHYAALRLAMATPRVGMIVTANPSTLVEFARLAASQAESLVRDIHDGTLSPPGDLPGEVRAALKPHTRRRDPARARQLEEILRSSGTLAPRDVWPLMSVLAVWTGGSVGVYLPLVRQYYGPVAIRDHGLSASEGRMTIPLVDGTPAGVLDYVHHYFEFIPEDEHGGAGPTVLEPHELQEGRNYYILLSTSGGLYRYDIHDVVRCTGFQGQAPLLEFLNKGAHFSSVTGEKLSEFQAVAAVRESFAELGVPLEHFTLAPQLADRPGYVLLLEPGPHSGREQELARRVEAHLSRLNCEYQAKVESGRLLPVSVRPVPPGTWAAFRRQRIAQRGNLEEYKHPCLVGDLEFVDRLLSAPPAAAPSSVRASPE